ncbi:hypothetical protein WHI96_11755 [Pseudonocardia tropica]|uniref:Uncharacterized protein n=1 Tax=Pseudonocardia tropica TaxID=681289 RepID=A0ABV1JU74_9PSEU
MRRALTTPSDGTAPDVAGVVVGWRCWRVTGPAAAPRLRSPVHVATEWPPGGALVARCELRGHEAPDPACTCGLHAVRDPARVGGVGFGPGTVLGCVALWGLVVEGEHGWRAGAAAPLVLFCGPALGEPERGGLARTYRVGVHRLPLPVAATVERGLPAAAAGGVRAAAVTGRGLDDAAAAFVAAVPEPDAPARPVRVPRPRRFALGTTAVLAVLAAAAASPVEHVPVPAPPGVVVPR